MKHVPKHRAKPNRPTVDDARRRAARGTVVLTSVAVAATGVAVTGGVLGSPASVSVAIDQQNDADAASLTAQAPAEAEATEEVSEEVSEEVAAATAERERTALSRSSDRREAAVPAKQATLVEPEAAPQETAMTASESLSDSDPRDIARALMPDFGFPSDQFSCLDSLWIKESNWNPLAANPTSSAYGIPQSLPGSKMASVGADWQTNPVTQITWGLGYIRDRYGSPCSAWGHSQSVGWY